MPVRSSRGHLKYTGRIARDSFVAWTDTIAGRAAVEQLAARMEFAFFGKLRAARRQVWRQLAQTARSEAVGAAVQREVDASLGRLDTFVFADGLPCVTIELRRLIVVPRLLVNGETYRRIDEALHRQRTFNALKGGPSLQRWFERTIVESLATVVAQTRPSLRRPVPAGDGWIVVGVNEQFDWQVPPAWAGHFLVLELTRRPMTRTVRKAVASAITQLETALESLSIADRDAIIMRASKSLDRLFGVRSA